MSPFRFHVFVFEKSWNDSVALIWVQGEAQFTSPEPASAMTCSCSWVLIDPTPCEDTLGFVPVFCHPKVRCLKVIFWVPPTIPGKPETSPEQSVGSLGMWCISPWRFSAPDHSRGGWNLGSCLLSASSSLEWGQHLLTYVGNIHLLSHFLMKLCDLWVSDMKSAQTLIPWGGEATKDLWQCLRTWMCLIAAFLELSTNLCEEIKRRITSLCCISMTNRICVLIAPWFCLVSRVSGKWDLFI